MNRILNAAAFAAAITLTPRLIAGDCAASQSASASTREAGRDIVAVTAGAGNSNTLFAAVKGSGLVQTCQG